MIETAPLLRRDGETWRTSVLLFCEDKSLYITGEVRCFYDNHLTSIKVGIIYFYNSELVGSQLGK